MFVAHLTRALKLPGLARSAEPVWVTPRGVRPDYLDLERVSPSTGYRLPNCGPVPMATRR